MRLWLASCAALLLLTPGVEGQAKTSDRLAYVEVIGKSVLLTEQPSVGQGACTLATASESVLARLAAIPSGTKVRMVVERLGYPVFSPLAAGQIGDRAAEVRGQVLAPWCGGPDFFWIADARPESGLAQLRAARR